MWGESSSWKSLQDEIKVPKNEYSIQFLFSISHYDKLLVTEFLKFFQLQNAGCFLSSNTPHSTYYIG